MAHEEALLIVVGIDEPAGDAAGAVAAHLASTGIEDVDAVHFDTDATSVNRQHRDVGFTEDDEEVPLSGVLKVLSHVEVGVHARLHHWNPAETAELRGVRVVVEGARNEK